MNKLIIYRWLLVFIFSGFMALILPSPHLGSAQTTTDPWSVPINLSHSGAATDPMMLVDGDGIIHIFWHDRYDGTLYSYGDGVKWSTPVPVTFPFGAAQPHFVADNNGRIHAFWVDEQGNLLYSFVKSVSFDDYASWEDRRIIAGGITDIAVSIDSHGRIRLVYLRNQESAELPAGVYYQHVSVYDFKWTWPVLLYKSPYLRGLNIDSSNLNIASADIGDATWVYVVWDNRPRRQVLLVRSKDGGGNWEQPVEIDKLDTSSGSKTPFNIHIKASGKQALLIWQSGDLGGSCSQYYQTSTDGGETWINRQVMLEGISGCALDNRFIHASENLFILQTTLQDQIYLIAWNGTQWSYPQPQDTLNSFTDPEIFNTINFRCRQTVYLPTQDKLLVVGCDANSIPTQNNASNNRTSISGDIWLTNRTLGDVNVWFPPPAVWSAPSIIASSDSAMMTPVMIADQEGRVHLFWTQSGNASSGASGTQSSPGEGIYYMRWDGEQWLRPVSILTSIDGEMRQLAVTIDAKGRLLLVWNTGQSGGIFFSWANASRATSPSEWANPIILPISQTIASSPDIIVDTAGVIYVAYAVPVNEGRGIYLVKSQDDGRSWSVPVRVFDGIAAGWEMVDQPQLSSTSDGHLHLLWKKHSLASQTNALALYYAYSLNGGQSWSEATAVVEKTVVWSRIVGVGAQTVHRMWQEINAGRRTFWHQISNDSGLTWSRPVSLASFTEQIGPASLAIDSADRLHLVQFVYKTEGDIVLQHWRWEDERWLANESLDIDKKINTPNILVAAISIKGKLAVIYPGVLTDDKSSQLKENLFFTNRTIDVVGGTSAPQTALTPMPTETPTITGTQEVVSTPTPTSIPTLPPDLTTGPGPGFHIGSISMNNNYAGLMLGGGLAVFIVIIAFGTRLLLIRFGRR